MLVYLLFHSVLLGKIEAATATMVVTTTIAVEKFVCMINGHTVKHSLEYIVYEFYRIYTNHKH